MVMGHIKLLLHKAYRALYVFCVLLALIGGVSWLTSGKYAFFGYRPVYVVTGSMEPVIHAHSLVIAKTAVPDDISVGDIVVYKLFIRSNGNTSPAYVSVLHRVIAKTPDGGYILKGDANPCPDEATVYPDQIQYIIRGR